MSVQYGRDMEGVAKMKFEDMYILEFRLNLVVYL